MAKKSKPKPNPADVSSETLADKIGSAGLPMTADLVAILEVNQARLIGRAEMLAEQILKTWDPPLETGNERPHDIAQTATMLALAFCFGRSILPRDLSVNQLAAIESGLKRFEAFAEAKEQGR